MPAQAGDGPLWRERLVLVHGSGCSADSWQYQMDGLLRKFDVVVLDLPGHGHSTAVGEPSIERYATAVTSVIEGIGRRKVFLAGHSMGGQLRFRLH